jgi:hypothetical protein
MAKKKSKAYTGASSAQTTRPAQPSWRKPPARSRRQIHSQKANSRRLSAQVTPPPAARPTARPSARTLVRLRDDETAARRDWRTTLRTILRQGFVVVLLGAVIYGLVEFFQLPALAVTSGSAQIGGAHRLTPRAIYDASGVEGRNVFLIRQAEVEANLREMPGIASADVHLRLPNQILIDVKELRPLVAWQAGEETVWLAADGGVVPQAGAAPPLSLLDTTNTALAGSDAWRHKVLAHLAELQARHPGLTTFGYGDPQGLYYKSAEGWEVWLGDTGPMSHKVTVAAQASPKVSQSGAQAGVIDLRFSDERALWW